MGYIFELLVSRRMVHCIAAVVGPGCPRNSLQENKCTSHCISLHAIYLVIVVIITLLLCFYSSKYAFIHTLNSLAVCVKSRLAMHRIAFCSVCCLQDCMQITQS